MNNIIQTIQHTARAATVLLIALLAVQTAGAQEDIPEVSNAPGLAAAFENPTVSVVNVTDNITVVGGLEPLSGNRNLTINLNGNTISGDYLSFNVEPDGSLTINGGGQGGSVGNIISGNAYGPAIDNLGTVTLSHVNITTNSAFAITGTGMLYIGNNVSFNGWTVRPFDIEDVNITGNYMSNVVATVTVGGTPHYFENSGAALTYIVSHPDNDHFSLSGTTYTIHTATGWGVFCDLIADGESFSGKTVQLGDDITVSRMAGSDGHDFCGTFDGQGHTLTFTATAADNYCAPFRNVKGGSDEDHAITISNLNVKTTITANDFRHAAGLIALQWGHVNVTGCNADVTISSTVGESNPHDLYPAALVSQASSSDGGTLTVTGCTATGTISTDGKYAAGLVGIVQGTASISDCISRVTIDSSTSGDGTHGGIVATVTGSGSIEGCVFNGKLTTTNGTGNCAGFIAWGNGTISNCLYAPANIDTEHGETEVLTGDVNNYPSGTFYRGTAPTVSNCYYTRTLGTAQGKATRTVTAADEYTTVAVALTGDATEYNVSGITAYSGGGLQLGETLYYGSGDAVSLTLSNTATGAPDGYQYGYTASAGTLEGSTLTMPNQDVTVSVNTAILIVIPWDGDGSEGKPYLIKYTSQLDLLAHRVNGTHGETRQTDGYENKFFQLANDISYTHKANDEAGADTESNYEAIGDYNHYFRGHFDGNSKTISGIRIYKDGSSSTNSYQGIFGRTVGAYIHDLTLADARITGYGNTGGIVGYNVDGKVTHCHVAGDVAVCAVQSDAWWHGGIVGYNKGGTIEQCTSAATLTIADASNSKYYGGIAGENNSGTLRDNLAIGATVPAAADNNYGAITGSNGRTLQRNYYAACNVANVENATGVGCGYIDDGNGGYITADVTADNGAVCINTLALAANQAPDGNFWTTYYNSFLGFTIDEDENACAYTATYSGSQLTLHKLGKEIPAGTAVIIVADNNEVSMTAATDLDDFSGTNDLCGVDYDTDVADIRNDLGDGTFYVLGMTTVGNEKHFGFHRYMGEEMAAHKAFVFVSGSQSARSLTMVFDEATGISDATRLNNKEQIKNNNWFTLDGRRLQAKPTAPGIYVNNGRKVVIK